MFAKPAKALHHGSKSSSAFDVSQALLGHMDKNLDGVPLIRIVCKACRLVFHLCRRCYRGHVYCCEQCRSTAKREAHRIAQSRYRTSDKGRKANKDAERKRRIKTREKSVADRGSIPSSTAAKVSLFSLPGKIVCRFCGISGPVVTRFPRRGYRRALLRGDRSLKRDEAWQRADTPNVRRHDE